MIMRMISMPTEPERCMIRVHACNELDVMRLPIDDSRMLLLPQFVFFDTNTVQLHELVEVVDDDFHLMPIVPCCCMI